MDEIRKMMDEVSIHAPARGATGDVRCLGSGNDVSIHAPARGATIYPDWITDDLIGFNPRSREGSD